MVTNPQTSTNKNQQLIHKVQWYVKLRWFYLFGLAIPGLTALYANEGLSITFKRSLGIAICGLAYNGIFLVLTTQKNRSDNYYNTLGWLQIVSDTILTTGLVISGGGIESRAIVLYSIPIIISGAMFGSWATYNAAFLSVGFYDLIVLLDYEGIIRSGDIAAPQLHGNGGYTATTIAFYSVSLLIVGAVANFVSGLINKQEKLALIESRSLERATTDLAIQLGKSKEQNKALEETKATITKLLKDFEAEKTKLVEVTQKDEAVLNSIGDSIVVTDEYGQITKVNPEMEAMLGFKEKELIGKGIVSAIPTNTIDGAVVPPDQRAVFEALATGKTTHATYQIGRKDKTKLIAEFTATPYIIAGKPAGAVDIIRDVSQQAAIDKSKTEFVSLASHQLRTPLSTINWYLEMVLGGDAGKISGEQKKYLSEVYAANQRMVVLVNSLLNVSRIDLGTFAIEPVPVDLKETANNVISEQQGPIHKKKHKIIFNFPEDLKPYNADPKLAHIIFQNLISNAIKYTPDKGTITISVATDKKQKTLAISVADNGFGIPKAQQKKIFTKLFRADNVVSKDTDGTGLGLYLIKAIAKEAGGDIHFTSRENVGTTFTITLPIGGMKPREGTKGLSSVNST